VGAGRADFDRDAFGFVYMAAEEMGRPGALDEIANGGGTGMHSGLDLIERRAVRRGVADEDQRAERGERDEPFFDLTFGIFAGSREGGGAGVAETGDVEPGGGELPLVEIVQAVLVAQGGNLGGGFVVAGEYPDLFAARLQNLAAAIETLSPGDLVARGDVEIGIHGEDAFERPPIIMNVGEYE